MSIIYLVLIDGKNRLARDSRTSRLLWNYLLLSRLHPFCLPRNRLDTCACQGF